MSAPPALEVPVEAEGDFLLKALLFAVLVVGILLGWLVSKCVGCISWWLWPEPSGTATRWRAVVLRALRFIRKRRRVSLAFSNYRNHPLNHAPTAPSRKPRRRQVGDLLPLEEGPAFRDGSYGR